jgi:4-amino-4-deoxy-L-arabinose transferase-like glycosyltransferase
MGAGLPGSSGPDRRVRISRIRVTDALIAAAPLAAFILLWAFVRADPAAGTTVSNGPYTDEAWDVINARNFVLLGRFSTDDWNLHLVNVPFSAIVAAVFGIAGVGIAQARLVSIAATALTMVALGVGLRGTLGGRAALLAMLAYGGSTLVLFYGRLAFLEPSVAMWLTLGGVLALRARAARSGRWGLVAGLVLALAIGTKPSAAFAAAGLLAGVLAVGHGSVAVRRWVAAAIAVIAAAGAAWVVLIALPNLAAVRTDLRIWPAEPILSSPAAMIRTVAAFPFRNDEFLRLAAPVIAFGAIGLLLALRERRSMPPALAILAGAATGWLVLGLGLLLVAPYRPNRYEVPILPALAVLGGIGLWALGRMAGTWPRWRMPAIALALGIVLVAPGLVSYATWMSVATYRLPEIQAAVAAAIPDGEVAQGLLAPAFALQAPVVTIVSRAPTRVNPGDLYATRGVRWYIGAQGSAPGWSALHPAAWAARTQVLCAPWGAELDCLWRVP